MLRTYPAAAIFAKTESRAKAAPAMASFEIAAGEFEAVRTFIDGLEGADALIEDIGTSLDAISLT